MFCKILQCWREAKALQKALNCFLSLFLNAFTSSHDDCRLEREATEGKRVSTRAKRFFSFYEHFLAILLPSSSWLKNNSLGFPDLGQYWTILLLCCLLDCPTSNIFSTYGWSPQTEKYSLQAKNLQGFLLIHPLSVSVCLLCFFFFLSDILLSFCTSIFSLISFLYTLILKPSGFYSCNVSENQAISVRRVTSSGALI